VLDEGRAIEKRLSAYLHGLELCLQVPEGELGEDEAEHVRDTLRRFVCEPGREPAK
jgi:hypothetical protein